MNGLYIFRLRDIPVFVSLWYVALMAFFFFTMGGTAGAIWVGAVTISILVHEFGHGFVARHYGLQPRILLHGWGGLCAHKEASRDRHDVFILLMGPGAGLILGGLVLIPWLMLDSAWLAARPLLNQFLSAMLWINLVWSVVNLIPLWPLDGGQLFNIGLKQKLDVRTTHRITHGVGLAIAIGGALYGLSQQWFFLAILAGLLGWMNYSRLRSAPTIRGKKPRQKNEHAESLYDEALEAMEHHDWDEAVRLGHQMRSSPLSDKQLDQVWELLAVATANLGKYEEALRYAERAPDTEPIQEVRARCMDRLNAA